jgi:hypothetical protein
MYESEKNQVPYCNVENLKKWYFKEFWAFDKTWPTLDKFDHFLFSKCLYTNWNKIISFDMKKKGKSKTCPKKINKKVNLSA